MKIHLIKYYIFTQDTFNRRKFKLNAYIIMY